MARKERSGAGGVGAARQDSFCGVGESQQLAGIAADLPLSAG